MSDNFLNKFLVGFPLIIAMLLWLIFSIKCGLLFYGLINLGMYVHLTTTTLSNCLIGREIDGKADVFWKTIFLVISCLCLSIFFSI